MKRLFKLFAVAFVLLLLAAGNFTVYALPNQNEDVTQQTGSTRATQIVCGELTRGSFGMYPSTHFTPLCGFQKERIINIKFKTP